MAAKRIVSWFSCGAASAVATKLAIEDNKKNGNLPLNVVYTKVVNEHPDNKRFLSDCEAWFGQEIEVITNERYGGDISNVFRAVGFIKNQQGAACTRLLKRQMRAWYQGEDDIQVLGFTAEERERADNFTERNAGSFAYPLIDRYLSKSDVLAMVQDAGIKLPVMYELGYLNNNCIGCVKGGMGYWNKIRRDFPDRFAEMAALEREIGFSVCKDEAGPVFLDELAPERGNYQDEPDIDCSIFCAGAKQEYAA